MALIVGSTHCTRCSLGKVSLGDDPADSEWDDSICCGVAVGEMEGVLSAVVVGVIKWDGVVTEPQVLSLKLVMPGSESCVEVITMVCGLSNDVEWCDFEDEEDDFRLLLLPSPLRCLDDDDFLFDDLL